jgi:hypothetical protein
MADTKISAESAASALGGTEAFVAVQSAANVKVTATQIKTWTSSAPTITGHPVVEGVTSTGATGTGKFVFDGTPTISTPTISGHPTVEGITSTGATGTGKFVFDGTPTLVTPVLGVATATSLNGNTFTTGTYTLTGTAGKTLNFTNTITMSGTDSTTMTFPPASASLGYLGVPVNSQSAAYTTVLGDAGKVILHALADTNDRTFTIDSSANVAYPAGTVLTFVNQVNTVTIAITTDTMKLAGAGTTGSRTLAANGIATAVKLNTGTPVWLISGTGLT